MGCSESVNFVEKHPDVKIEYKYAIKVCAQIGCHMEYYLVDNYHIMYSISQKEYDSYSQISEVTDLSATPSGVFPKNAAPVIIWCP